MADDHRAHVDRLLAEVAEHPSLERKTVLLREAQVHALLEVAEAIRGTR